MLFATIGVGLLVGSVGTSLTLSRSLSLNVPRTLTATFKSLGLGVQQGNSFALPVINAQLEYAWGTRLLCNLPAGLPSAKVIDQRGAIAEALRSDVDIYWKEGLIIDVFRGEMERSLPYPAAPRHDYKIAIGATRRYEVRYYDFAGSFPHLLIGGISGGGKSVLLRSVLTQLATGPQPDLYLADLKGGVELNLYRDLAITKGFATTIPALRKMVDAVETEMDRRYEIMERSGTQEWQGKRAILVMDELADLKARQKDPEAESKAAIKARLTALSAKGRAAGVILVLCTQRPDASIVDGLIKTNIATSICFRTRDATQSRIILDSNDAAALPDVPGRCIFQQAHDEMLQTYYLSYDQAKELLAGCERKAEQHEPDPIEGGAVDSNIGELGAAGLPDNKPDHAAPPARRPKKRKSDPKRHGGPSELV